MSKKSKPKKGRLAEKTKPVSSVSPSSLDLTQQRRQEETLSPAIVWPKKQTNDPNQPISQEADELGKKLKRQFDGGPSCPIDFADVELIKQIVKQYRKKGFPSVDVTPMIAFHEYAVSASIEPRLPRLCSYNKNLQHFFDYSFHCSDSNNCYEQGKLRNTHDCHHFTRYKNSYFGGLYNSSKPYLWVARGASCSGVRSYREDRDTEKMTVGDMILIPLGSGVFLRVLESHRGVYSYGLIFAPK